MIFIVQLFVLVFLVILLIFEVYAHASGNRMISYSKSNSNRRSTALSWAVTVGNTNLAILAAILILDVLEWLK